jgi:hypothetical protein
MTFRRIVQAITPRNRLQAAAVAAILVGSLTAGVSYAAIPDASGVIHGCFANKGGGLKVIDATVKTSCPKGTTSLNWNQTGPSGPTGTCPGIPHEGIDLSGCDLAGANLGGVDLTGSDLRPIRHESMRRTVCLP